MADTGNNDLKRTTVAVHQVDEPSPSERSHPIEIRQTWHLRFPDGPSDCESLFIRGTNGYVISKVFNNSGAIIYRFPLGPPGIEPFTLVKVTELPVTSPVTGAALSSDGRRLGIVCKSGAYLFRVKKGDIATVGLGKPHLTRFKDERIEGCCFVPDGLLATAESREVYLFTDPAFRGEKKP